MFDDDLRRRAEQYRLLASSCDEPVARLLLDRCARDYEREAEREGAPADADAAC